MKNRFLKLICACLSILTLLCVLTLPTFAEGSTITAWTVTKDLTTLSDGETTYYYYDLPSAYQLSLRTSRYYYAATSVTVHETGEELTVSSIQTVPDSGIIVLSLSNQNITVYATREATKQLNEYFSADGFTNCHLREERTYYAAKLSDEAVRLLSDPAMTQPHVTDVTALKNLTCHKLITCDPSGSFSATVGGIYQFDEETYGFIDYTLLDNTHFDANGDFSYRSGTVTVSILRSDADANVKSAVESFEYVDFSFEYEDEIDFSGFSVGFFWVMFIIIGFLLPIAPLLVGLLLPQSAKRTYPKRWYTLAVFAIIWMIAAAVIAVILLW